MLEHELLMLLAAPLLVLSEPLVVMLWALPPSWRVGLGRIALSSPMANVWQALASPLVATFLQAAALWLWHAPALFDRALGSEGWHIVQHLCFVITGLIFWHAMLSPSTARPRGALPFCDFAGGRSARRFDGFRGQPLVRTLCSYRNGAFRFDARAGPATGRPPDVGARRLGPYRCGLSDDPRHDR
jgi:hypothetical protein